MQRLLGGGANISDVERLNGQRRWRVALSQCNIAIIAVVLGCHVALGMFPTRHKISNRKFSGAMIQSIL